MLATLSHIVSFANKVSIPYPLYIQITTILKILNSRRSQTISDRTPAFINIYLIFSSFDAIPTTSSVLNWLHTYFGLKQNIWGKYFSPKNTVSINLPTVLCKEKYLIQLSDIFYIVVKRKDNNSIQEDGFSLNITINTSKAVFFY